MDETTRERLLELNRDFYAREAESFSATRNHPWPGWVRVVDGLPPGSIRVLDVGCGNGRLARFLLERDGPVHYLGIDSSPQLVDAARNATPGDTVRFEVLDVIAAPDAIPIGPFDLIGVFGLIHHLPGFDTRLGLIRTLASRLAPGGRLAVTCWRFGDDPRVAGRLLDWGDVVDASKLDPGDHLLRWGEAPDVGRYCHFADSDEIDELARSGQAMGLELADRFRSDGRSGDLNEYLVWSRP